MQNHFRQDRKIALNHGTAYLRLQHVCRAHWFFEWKVGWGWGVKWGGGGGRVNGGEGGTGGRLLTVCGRMNDSKVAITL